MPNEVELKFDLDPGDVTLVRAAPVLASSACDTRNHETVYFDTAGRALRRAGYSLRVRRTGDRFVQTVKHKSGGAVGLFVRREWESEVPALAPALDALKGSAAKRILTAVGADPLLPVVRTEVSRTRWMVDHRESRIEVVLDVGRVRGGDAEAPICELELELVHGKPRSLFRLAEEVGAAVPLRLGVLSKGERGYALAEGRLGAAAKAEPVALGHDMERRAAFQAIAYACLRHFRVNEIVLLSGGRDSEALHQARVALRRLRSAFALFRPALAGKDFRHLRAELAWLAAQFGEARDLDVLIAGSEEVGAELRRRRLQAYERVEAALHSPRVRSLLLDLALWIEAGTWRFRDGAGDPLGPFASNRLDRLWEKVQHRGSSIAALDPDSRHKLRIDVKKLRYSAEFLADVHAGKSHRARRDRFLAAIESLQDRLGHINDARLALRSDSADSLLAAQRAFDRATVAAGYWRS
ncbi:CHAD domain-containing protein [Sphingosinicella sp. CPCC 101087]|uniref:CYTH and CHAD domain-containing protein n=1 Tax=Sphingosinicella sp. CPCC 101087 TaxID=2497754 RepID=UPI0013EA3457|nr:CHAD domain-containing protein [Sphingosinicella sp. CPCC 101087]